MRTAFTAIEFAVVLVILVILAALLIPALEEGQNEARRAKCIGRMRQVGMAMQLYQSGHNGHWPWARVSVHPERRDWPDPTGSLAVLYPSYAPKAYLFQCPATDDVVELAGDGRDFLDCGNFYVSPKGKPYRPEDVGKGAPRPPSYFYEARDIPRNASSSRVVYGDECVHGYLKEEGLWLGDDNHPMGGGNFMFADKHIEWLKLEWTGRPWDEQQSRPYVANPHIVDHRAGTFGVPVDSNVFAADWGGKKLDQDAALAGMTWAAGTWREF